MLLIYEPTERANPTQMLAHSYLAELMNPAATLAAMAAVGKAGGPMEVAGGAEGANVVPGEADASGARR
jgi:hypothetical protein